MIVHPMPIPAFIVNSNEQCFRLNKFIFTNNSSIATGSLTHKWRFGDTGVSTVTSPGYSYQSVGGFKVSLKSTSNFGCIDSTFDFVLVDPMPVSNFTINDTTQCLNDQNFIVKDVSTILSGTLTRKWAFDDGVFSTLATVNKTFVKDTIHSIKLIQTSDRGCLDSIMKIIEVYSKPIPAFIVNDTDQCMRQNNFIFTNGSSIRKGSLTYQWKFGDLTNSTFASPSHRYFAFGNYTATLTAISENGCLDSLKKRLRVDPMPAVSFSVNDTGQCINNQSFVFTNNSTIPVGSIQHLWKFGDGNTSNLANSVKQFAKDTIYRVLLTETSNKGCVDSVQKIMDVYPKPMVNFAVDDSIQCQFQNAYIFTNKSYIKYGSLSYTWNFGDGNKSNGISSNHSYSSFGNYKVVLNSISDLGCIDSFKKIITVAAMPKVDFRVNDPGQCFRIQNFVYTNRSTLALGTMTSKWYFGDSDTLRSLNATHVYKSIGSYKPKLIMTTNYGCKDSIQYTVIVNPNARASYTTNDSDQCINRQNYVFTNTSSVNPGQIKGILWSLGNGQTSVQQQASTSYPKSGWYRIILQTTTDSGCVDSFSNRIRVYPKPLAWFDVNDSAQCLYQNDYIFNDLSFDSINITNYNWNINNESQQSTKAANYIFGTPGYKTVTLIASSSRGCYDTSQRQVYVKPMPDPRFEVLKSYYCELTGPYNFAPTTPGGTYFGKNIQFNSYNPVLLWEDTVKYVVTVNGCTDSSMQLTNVYPGPKVYLGKDTTLCKYEVLELFVNSWQSKIKWNDGSTGPYLRVLDPGVYSVIATNICGKETDSIEVSFRDINCRFFLPTAFTPNNDGLNDRYKPLIYEVGEMKYQIFDRWGELIYEGNEKDEGWDGTFGEELVPLGNYLVHVTYLYTSSFHYIKITDSGMFILIR
jgi:gliding motility-associated-like protein